MPNRIKSYLLQIGHVLRLRGPLAGEVRARTLHGLVVGLLLYIWTVQIPVIMPIFVMRKAGSSLINLYLTLIYGITLVLLRRGSLRQASVLYLAGTWVAASVFIVSSGGIQSTALVHYVNLPILAAWLLGASAAGVMTVICLGGALILAVVAQSGYALPHYFPGAAFANWSSLAMATLATVVPVLFVLNALNEALEKRQGAEEELRQANEKLEQRVRERTAQLQEANDNLQIHLSEQKRLETGLELAARFPGENPNAVMRLGQGHLVDFGNPAAQALLRSLGCSVAGEAPASIAEPAAAALKEGTPRQIEKTYSDRTYLFSLAPIPQWGYVNLYAIDITERKRVEEALRESENRERARAAEFEALMEAAPVGIFVSKDTECRWMSGNRTAYDLLRRPRGSNLSKSGPEDEKPVNFRAMKDGKEIPLPELPMQRSAASGKAVRDHEMDFVFEDGVTVNILGNVVPLLDESGRPRGAVGTFLDITERKRAEEAQRASERRFRVLAEAMPQIVWSADATGTLEYVNPHAIKYAGARLEDVIGWKWASLIHPDDWAAMDAAWRRALTSGASDQIEHRLRRADGEYRWHLTRAVPLRNEKGEVIHWIGTATDIHDQKMAEQELERRVAERTAELGESQTLTNAIVESTSDFIWSVDPERFGLLTFNGGLSEHFLRRGVRLQKGMRPEDAFSDQNLAARWRGIYQRTLSEGSYTVDYESPTAGSMLVTANLLKRDGKVFGISVFGKDITERVRAERARQESEEAFRTLAESAPQMVWMCTPDGLNVYFNQRWVDYTGLSLEESYGRGWNTPFHPDDKQPAWRAWNHAVETGDTYNIECRLRRADGIYRWFLIRGVPLRDSKGNVVKWFGTCTDIDDLKRAEAELRRLNRALRACSATDQAMVRAQNEPELLQETCRILVEEGGYRMAWVGLAEQDAEKRVRLVAHAGINDGYLETAKISWADTERGRGPTGTAIRMGRPTVCQNMLEDQRIAPWREEAARRGYASSCALPLVVGGKPIGALTVYSRYQEAFDTAEADLLAQLGADVAFGIESLRARTERHQAMEALQRSESRYKNFISHSTDGVWRIELTKPLPLGLPEDEGLKWLFEQGYMAECNAAYAAIYGHSDPEQLTGKKLGELIPALDEARIESFRSMIRGGFQTRTFELRALDSTCKFKDLLRTEVPIVENGLLLRFWGITSDITERKRAEMELRRANRALRILSSSSQALVRAQAESQLPQEICRILVEEGGYRMAWMGFAEHDADKTLRPVAYAGVEEGYLASMKLSWADTERGRGPGGVAIRTGQPSVCNNIMDEPQFALWREDAVQRGYASTCVLPMTLDGQPMAVLAVYSPVPDAFDPAEVKLLAELVDDITFGFHVLHTRAERQQAMETLEKHSSQLAELARLLELAPVAVLVRDLESRITYWNRGAEEIYGWTSTEASGKVTHSLLQTKFPESLSEMEAKIFSGVTWHGELTHHKRTGEEVAVVSRQVLRHDKQGNPTGYLEINLDISARIQAEEALKAERQRFFAVLETLPPMICLLTPDYHVAFANRAFRERFGESQGRRCYDYCFGNSAPCEFCQTYNVLKTGQPQHWEVNCPDGSVIDVYDFPFKDADGTPLILEMDVDITEAKRAKEGLEKANTYNRSLLEASLDPLVTISPNGKITDVNSAAEKVTGRLREELIGADFSDYFTDPEKARLGYQQVFREGLVQNYELEVRHRDGSTTPVLYNASVYRDEGDEVVGVFAAARDITTRKRAEEEVRRLNEELEQRVRLRTAQLEASNKELESFSYSVSHDLRAPLRAMDGFSRILLEEYRPQLPSNAQRYLDFVRDGASHMGNLIDGLLALSRLGRQELKRRPVEVAEIVEQSMDDLQADVEGSTAEFVVGCLPSCDADPLLLRQVFVNLLSNALKFSRKQQKVRIEIGALRAYEAAQAPAHVLRLLDRDSWVYYVRDNGVGFDMRYAEKLFGVFQRLHRQEEFKGTGIGLATVQQIIHKHGGQVWAEAEVGKGATFYFTIGPSVGDTTDSHVEIRK